MEDPEWVEAQNIIISIDLIAKTKKHLHFLKAIDDNGNLYGGPLLERAIFRYKYYWLPLLAKYNDCNVREWPLVVPLECEWIWHCHRLNPVRYVDDCKELFGRILDPCGVVISSTEGTCKKRTEELWNNMHPEEPYELNLDCFDSDIENKSISTPSTAYDLVSAVKRQSSFYYQVSRAFMEDDIFLEGAVQRYKGFLHLIRRNMESKLENFCVPTYDIDLMWHTHQLHALSYCNDMVSLLGKVLDHNDMDSDRTKGQKLDVGFARTTKQWKDVFSSRYLRAGAMCRGVGPGRRYVACVHRQTQSSEIMLFTEILLEIIEVKNLPRNQKGNLVLSVSKKQHDMLFEGKTQLSICTDTKETQVVIFQCEPKGELLFEFIDESLKSLGTCSLPLSKLDSKLASPKWLEFESGLPLPITLGIVISSTSPVHNICKKSGGGGCGTACASANVWAPGGMCSGSGGCGGGGGGCSAKCGGCRSSCGGGCRGGGGGNCSVK